MNEYILRESIGLTDFEIAMCGGDYKDLCRMILEKIINAPAADVRPVVRGKWIPVGTDDMDEGMFKCSECGSEHFFPEILLDIPADNFCSNCGADMREES